MSNRVGNGLRELGVEMEDRVLIVLPDCPEFVWSWFGAARIGAVITMVNPLLPAEDYRYYLEYTRARVAIVHESFLKPIIEALPGSNHLRSLIIVRNEDAIDEEPLSVKSPAKLVYFSEVVDGQLPGLQAGGNASRRHRHLVVHLWLDRTSQRRGPLAARSALQHRGLCETNDGS
jgi:acyl-coenzyme A synthetase/AMP-(fatty) acid ligase